MVWLIVDCVEEQNCWDPRTNLTAQFSHLIKEIFKVVSLIIVFVFTCTHHPISINSSSGGGGDGGQSYRVATFALRLACSLLLIIGLLTICEKVNSDFIMVPYKVVLRN